VWAFGDAETEMSRLLVIDDVFAIKGRGVAVVGKNDRTELPRFFLGDKVELRRRDGSNRNAKITGIGMGAMLSGFVDLLLDPSITEEDIGVGDELWLLPK
jgi:translation elongation factor EF-Tu-like GTPase